MYASPAAGAAGLALMAGIFLFIAFPAWAKQENNPIVGQVTPEVVSVAASGEIVSFTVSMETERRFSRMALEIKIPEGITLISGRERQEFTDFKPGEKQSFHFSLKIGSLKEKQIFFTARAMELKDEAVSQVMVAVVNPSPSDKSFIEIDKSGQSFRVYGIQ